MVANHALSGSSGGSAIGTGSTDDGSGGLAFTGDPARAWTWTTAEPSQATWSPVIGLSLVPAAASNLPDGRVLLWSAEQRLSFNDPGRTYTTIFDPVAGRATERLVTETGHDMFCPGTTNLPDGRLLVSGGIDSGNVSIFDPVNSSWTSAAQMNIPRGYHSNVLTADGGVLVLGGSWSGGVGNKNGEIWTPFDRVAPAAGRAGRPHGRARSRRHVPSRQSPLAVRHRRSTGVPCRSVGQHDLDHHCRQRQRHGRRRARRRRLQPERKRGDVRHRPHPEDRRRAGLRERGGHDQQLHDLPRRRGVGPQAPRPWPFLGPSTTAWCFPTARSW